VDVYDKMDVFTLAIMGLGVRSFDQSKNGCGLKLVTVKSIRNNKPSYPRSKQELAS